MAFIIKCIDALRAPDRCSLNGALQKKFQELGLQFCIPTSGNAVERSGTQEVLSSITCSPALLLRRAFEDYEQHLRTWLNESIEPPTQLLALLRKSVAFYWGEFTLNGCTDTDRSFEREVLPPARVERHFVTISRYLFVANAKASVQQTPSTDDEQKLAVWAADFYDRFSLGDVGCYCSAFDGFEA